MGVATTRAPNSLGPPNPTKKLAHRVDLLGQPLSQNHVFEILRGELWSGNMINKAHADVWVFIFFVNNKKNLLKFVYNEWT